jgi:hypothetical protein
MNLSILKHMLVTRCLNVYNQKKEWLLAVSSHMISCSKLPSNSFVTSYYSQGLGTPLVDFGEIDIHVVVMTSITCPFCNHNK